MEHGDTSNEVGALRDELAAVRREIAADRRAGARGLRFAVLVGIAVLPAAAGAFDFPFLDFQQGDAITADGMNQRFAALASGITAVEADVANNATDVADLQARLDAVEPIRADLTIPVDDCDDLHAELGMLRERRILAGTVTLQLPTGIFVCAETLRVDHPDGFHVEILGMPGTTLAFDGIKGMEVEPGRAVGFVDYITFDSNGTGGAHGIQVNANGTLGLGNNVVVKEFGGHGIFTHAGYIAATGVLSSQNGVYGWLAEVGGAISAPSASAMDNGDIGFFARRGATVDLQGASATGNLYGFFATGGSVIEATNSSAIDSGSIGYYSGFNSTVIAGQAESEGHTHGFYSEYDSLSYLGVPTSNDNTTGFAAYSGSYAFLSGAPLGDATNAAPSLNSFQPLTRALVQQD